MTVIEAVDVEGAVKAYLAGYPGLTGPGNPLAGGIHLGHPRLPAVGAIGEIRSGPSRAIDDTWDQARIEVYVRAAGKAARSVAESGCRAVAVALLAVCGPQPVVQTARGDWVKILRIGNGSGPSIAGDLGSEVVYVFDCDVQCQPATGP